MTKSLYIHIPFCQSRCFYCDFYSTAGRNDLAPSFVDALSGEIELLEPGFETIYIGGGTPTALDTRLLKKLFQKMGKIIAGAKECTVEANPESLSKEKIILLRDLGINRISIGCQSFNQNKLKFLGRAHTSNQAETAVLNAEKNGFKNISIDLIFGLPGEALSVWENDCKQAINLPISHLSLYMLTYESGTLLFEFLKRKEFYPLDDGKVALMYRRAIEIAAQKEIKQYEISNFAKEGFYCRHNMKYWENEPYLGLGPSAVSFEGRRRRKNISSLKDYIASVKKDGKKWDFSEQLSALESAKETASLKIRTIEGVNFNWFRQKTGFDLSRLKKETLAELAKKGLIRYSLSGEEISLTGKGILFADTVSSMLL